MTGSRVHTTIDSPHTQPWLAPIGKLAVNFGALELQSYLWIALLSDDTQVGWALGQLFKPRVKRILKLVAETAIETELASDVTEAWNEALEIATFRNSVLHSPLVFAYSASDKSGPPDVIGMPDVRQLRKGSPVRPIAKLVDINSAVNRIVACTARLERLRGRARALLDPRHLEDDA